MEIKEKEKVKKEKSLKKSSDGITKAIIHRINYSRRGTLQSIYQYIDRNHEKEISDSRVVKLPHWCIVLSILGLIAILIILLAALIILSFAPRHALHNENCSSRSCVKGFGLKCIDKVCSCYPEQYYAKGCIAKKTYLEKCNGQTGYCKNGTDLVCRDGVCKCLTNNYWNGKLCTTQKSYSGLCTVSTECQTDAILICSATLKRCVCESNRFWDGQACVLKRSFDESCLNSSSSYMCKTDTQNTICASNGTSFSCVCTSSYYFDYNFGICRRQLAFNSTCVYTQMCLVSLGLQCISSVCTCDFIIEYYNGTHCLPKKVYANPCTSSSECNDAAGLVCPATTGICNCPTPSTSIFCDCPAGYYYDSGTTKCELLKDYSDTCSADYQCNGTTTGLKCYSGKCGCETSSRMFWSPKSGQCAYCPVGWVLYPQNCYIVEDTVQRTWDQAEAYCQTFGANLIKIDNNAEYNILFGFYNTYSKGGNLWVGAKSPTVFDFRWSVDNTQLAKTSSWWCGSEPNNSGGSASVVSEGCVFMWTAGGRICFNDISCTNTADTCCEKSTFETYTPDSIKRFCFTL